MKASPTPSKPITPTPHRTWGYQLFSLWPVGVGQKIALYASQTAKHSAFLKSAFPIPFIFLFFSLLLQFLFKTKGDKRHNSESCDSMCDGIDHRKGHLHSWKASETAGLDLDLTFSSHVVCWSVGRELIGRNKPRSNSRECVLSPAETTWTKQAATHHTFYLKLRQSNDVCRCLGMCRDN